MASTGKNIKYLLDCLVTGYVREKYIDKSKDIYPLSLNDVISEFLGNILFRFDLIRKDLHGVIHENGIVLKGIDELCIVGSSFGIRYGIHEFKVEIIKAGPDIIGITTDIEKFIDKDRQWLYDSASAIKSASGCSWYGSKQYSSTIFVYKDGKNSANTKLSAGIACWKAGDILKLIVNCEQWNMSFYKNDELMAADISIQPNMTYHVMMNLNTHGCEYKFIR